MSIFIGLGANLDHPKFGSPRETLLNALEILDERGVHLRQLSPWYRTAPVPVSEQPWYFNAVACVSSGLGPDALLATLHGVEDFFGRVRAARNAARLIDLDLLDYKSCVKSMNYIGLSVLPHPRLENRAFVLQPLRDIAPAWRHPVSGLPIGTLIDALPADQPIERLD